MSVARPLRCIVPFSGSIDSFAALFYAIKARHAIVDLLWISRVSAKDRKEQEESSVSQVLNHVTDGRGRMMKLRELAGPSFREEMKENNDSNPASAICHPRARKISRLLHLLFASTLDIQTICVSLRGIPTEERVTLNLLAFRNNWKIEDVHQYVKSRPYKTILDFVASFIDDEVENLIEKQYSHFVNVQNLDDISIYDLKVSFAWNWIRICPLPKKQFLENRKLFDEDIDYIPFKKCCGICKKCRHVWDWFARHYSTSPRVCPVTSSDSEYGSSFSNSENES